MKKIKWLASLPLFMLLAFSPGGDSYKVYLGDKLLTEQFVHIQKSIPTIAIPSSGSESVTVQFSHCGLQGKSRNISIRAASGKILKEWKFGDSDKMQFSPGEISKLGARLNLYYASKEIPEGRLLATIELNGKATASRD